MSHVKLAGALLVIFSSSLLGIVSGEELKKKMEILQDFRSLLCIVRSGIEYNRQMLVEIFEGARGLVGREAGELAQRVSTNLLREEKMDFYEAWETAVFETYSGTAAKSEIPHFLEPGKVLGVLDAKLRIAGIDATVDLLEQKIKKEQSVMAERCYRRKCLGFLFGLFVTIIFL